MRILTPEAMREVDRQAIEELGIPGMVLMENAALGVLDALAERFPAARRVAVFCGPGNNGGDGLALGRHLAARGYRAELFLAAAAGPDGDAGRQLAICERAGLAVERLAESGLESALARAAEADVVVDALFGTGLDRPLTGLFAELVAAINRLPVPRLAVDVASGLDAGRAEPIGPHVEADLTVAFAAPKPAHVFPPAAWAAGEVVVADLGIPARLVARAGGDLWLLEGSELAPLLAARAPEAHKGDFGHALVVGGSIGKSGAVALAARAALRAGAGLVTVAVPEPLVPVLETATLETMTLPLPVAGDGGLDPGGEEALRSALAGKDAWALGPGLGQAGGTAELVRRALGFSSAPLVLDADGINAFGGRAAELAERDGPTVLTPHPGELARLLAVDTEEVTADRPASVRRATELTACVVVLKGHLTLIADPLGGVFVNPTGNPGMATAGTGDVLTGLVAGILAQGVDALAAAQLAVFVHGAAGDLAAAELGEAAMTAGDLLARVPAAVRALAAGG